MVSPERSALNDAMARLKADLLRCCQSIIVEFTRKMSPTARRYWYLSIGCGLVVGALMASAFLLHEFDLLQLSEQIYYLLWFGGFVFGAGFAVCLRAARVTSLWRASTFAICIGAAHFLAWLFSIKFHGVLPVHFEVAGSFLWGLVFGTVVASCAAFLFASVQSLRLLGLTVLSSVVMALSYLLLRLMDPTGGVALPAAEVAIGLVYATVAAILGWKLFQGTPRDASSNFARSPS